MAMCINQPGSCGCKCVNGFTGDGTQCNGRLSVPELARTLMTCITVSYVSPSIKIGRDFSNEA